VNILVVLRMVPDAAGELQLADDGLAVDREWLDFQLNDFDDHALEDAVLLKEAAGARVSVVGMGEGANRILQMAAARGADELIVLPAPAEDIISSRDIAATVAALAREKAADLVITGVLSAEDIFGQLCPYVGAMLGWPHVSGTNRVALAGEKLHVSQERGAGVSVTYELTLPAVLGVQTATKAPRYVSGSKLREAAKTPIGRGEMREPGFAAGARIASLRLPAEGGRVEILGDNAENVADRIVAILANNGN
jgi:electron transfer flavoprotein beta subunit